MLRYAMAALLAASAIPVSAASFFNNTTGLSGTFTTVDLTTPTLPTATPLTNQFSSQGLTFANATYDPQPGFYSGPSVGNFVFGGPFFPNMTLQYQAGVTDVAFRMITNPGTSQFDAYLGGTLVAQAFIVTGTDLTQWYGFTGGGFDRIVITGGGTNGALLATDFQIAGGVVPEPASWTMMILGFGLVGAGMRRRTAVTA